MSKPTSPTPEIHGQLDLPVRDFTLNDFKQEVERIPEICAELLSRPGAWREAAEQLREGRSAETSLRFFGEGSSYHVSQLVTHVARQQGFRARAFSSAEWLLAMPGATLQGATQGTLHGTPQGTSQGTFASQAARELVRWDFGISHSGKTASTRAALRQIGGSPGASNGGHRFWLTGGQGEALEGQGLQHWKLGPQERIEPHSHSLFSVALVTTLTLGVSSEAWHDLIQGAASRTSACSQWQESAREVASQVASHTHEPLVLLASGVDYWIAREFSLKLCELVGWVSSVYTTEEYFHGPARFLKPHRLLVLENSGHPRLDELKQRISVRKGERRAGNSLPGWDSIALQPSDVSPASPVAVLHRLWRAQQLLVSVLGRLSAAGS